MDAIKVFARDWALRLLSVLRVVFALCYMEHGTQKILDFPPAAMPHPYHLLTLVPGLAGVLEFGGGALLLVGLFGRPVAFLLSGEAAFVYFIGHAPRGLFPLLNGGESAVLYCFAFFYLAAAGPGPWSVDALLQRTPEP